MSDERPHILLCADAVAPTGFARVSYNLMRQLESRYRWSVLGLNALGDPAPDWPWDIYPAHLGGDMWGYARYRSLVDQLHPDAVMIINDAWNVAKYLKLKRDEQVVAYVPVDAPNCQDGSALNGLDLAIFYTCFGEQEVRLGGYAGPSVVIPHGVDLSVYHPVSTVEARRYLGLPELADAFIVGNVNRNQPRKRLDLTISAFARWVHEQSLPANVLLWLHAANRDRGWDLRQLAAYYGVGSRLVLTSEAMTSFAGVKESDMKYIYCAANVQISTTLGEGFGLSQIESMACMRPNIVPDWSALSEWAKDAAYLVPVSHTMATPERVNTIGGCVSEDAMVAALDRFYREPDLRLEYAQRGYDLALRPAYRWEIIAAQFDVALKGVLEGAHAAAETPA
jgi:D-inositol-3-phosphate glycosyltransferase